MKRMEDSEYRRDDATGGSSGEWLLLWSLDGA